MILDRKAKNAYVTRDREILSEDLKIALPLLDF